MDIRVPILAMHRPRRSRMVLISLMRHHPNRMDMPRRHSRVMPLRSHTVIRRRHSRDISII